MMLPAMIAFVIFKGNLLMKMVMIIAMMMSHKVGGLDEYLSPSHKHVLIPN